MFDTEATTVRREVRKPATVVRRLDPRAASGLREFHRSPLLQQGRVNLIALDAVAERLGERWQSHRDRVWEHLERTLSRHVGTAAIYLRVSDTDYIVAQPAAGEYGAQRICLRVADEVMGFYLGARRRREVSVHRVTTLTDHEITAIKIDRAVAAAGAREEAAEAEAAKAAAEDETLLSPGRWSPFVANSGRTVRVSCALEPVFEAKTHKRIGYRLRRRIIDVAAEEPIPVHELRHLSRADMLRIDMATIARGLARVTATAEDEHELSLIVPVSYITLSTIEGRHMIAEAFSRLRKLVLKGVICEVSEIDGAPQAALLQAVSLIKPHALFVIGRLDEEIPTGLSSLKGAGCRRCRSAVRPTSPGTPSSSVGCVGWSRQRAR
jgi:hypothetical protein